MTFDFNEFCSSDPLWQDREIRFDTPLSDLSLVKGEFEIDSINSVEDTKGNNGEKGALNCTNLRMIWISHKNARVNLSIGYDAIINTSIRMANSRLRGNSEALFVMAKYGGTRFEFIFTSLIKKSPRLFTTAQSVFRAYETSKLYRDLKLRGAIMKDKELIVLPDERILDKISGVWNLSSEQGFTTAQSVFRAYETSKLYRDLKLRGAIMKDKELIVLPDERILDKISGVWNLSSEQGNLGSFFITNIRVVWFANLAENFNVSIPYLQMKGVWKRNSKFGVALVIETTQQSGSYVLGFRLDPEHKLEATKDEIYKLWKVYSKNPMFGVHFETQKEPLPIEQVKIKHQADKVEILQNEDVDFGFHIASYYADVDKKKDLKVSYDADIGLAVESIANHDITMQKLWNVVIQ
eukprot:CAMPEP_0197072442 /NCGR_PEP_ID=MMETSP1384-20130603/210098_1 /TAXON_ID=29189 /ORGANISM="Ammonia sp." /LENGTH=408 /DNA_ID=CAMNT_0042511259 /DNA_START=31 /DNA_END=1257 /DNA_ORIENTATION=-